MEATNKKDTTTMIGVVSRVLYSNEDRNYAIVSLRSQDVPQFAVNKDYPDSFVATGCFVRAVQDQEFSLDGKWVKNAKYGWQFAVTNVNEVVPSTNEGIIRYLSSGLFKGIGPVTAEAVVKRFGDKTLDIIKEHPERLAEIKGISKGKAEVIAAGYRDFQYLEELMIRLKPCFVTNRKILQIYKTYGKKSMSVLDSNPYKLCDDIEGIGFKIADQIARACNVSFKDKFRIRACILFVLKEAGQAEGHLYLTRRTLVGRLKKLLNTTEGEIDSADIMPVLNEMGAYGEVVIEDTDIYLAMYHQAETYCAKRLMEQLEAPADMFNYDTVVTIRELEAENNIKYAPKQKEAIRNLEYSNILVITGGPGTGKTTVLKGMISTYKKNFKGKKIVLAAPTGRAAKRMNETTGLDSVTIHRLLEYKYSPDDKMYCARNEHNPIEADIIFIDEASMIDILLLTKFLKAVSLNTKIVFVGDVDQLPSVGPGTVLRDMINSNKLPVVMLNEIFRQENTSKIIINADLINKGETNLVYGEDFVFINENEEDKIPEVILDVYKKELAKVNGDIDKIQVLSPFRTKTCSGVDNLNNLLQDTVNPKTNPSNEIMIGKRIFRVKDKIQQFKNDYEREVFNGDTGCVKAISKSESGEVMLEMNINDSVVEYDKDDMEDLGLAYATTVHKSQGSEYDVVIMPLSMQHYILLIRNLLYTGITRAKKKVILVGTFKALAIAIKNNKIEERNTKLKARLNQI